ncbi:hypothetical protein [Streptomyces sp. NPDC058664]|uniref:hypothetical protein n=1 Tax=unclassified Streptomyces TaxID=2593676 RepID=UPI00365B670D
MSEHEDKSVAIGLRYLEASENLIRILRSYCSRETARRIFLRTDDPTEEGESVRAEIRRAGAIQFDTLWPKRPLTQKELRIKIAEDNLRKVTAEVVAAFKGEGKSRAEGWRILQEANGHVVDCDCLRCDSRELYYTDYWPVADD